MVLGTDIRVDGANSEGTDIDAEDVLGLSREKIQPRASVRWRPGHLAAQLGPVGGVEDHLGEVRHRSEVVEYWVAQYQEGLSERLKALEMSLP